MQQTENLPYPVPSNLNREKIEVIATNFAKEISFIPGGSLESVVSKLRGRIEYQDYDDWTISEDASIEIFDKNNFIIKISNFTGRLRNRFSIAHEIGHYVLHSDFGSIPIRAKRFGKEPVEIEADQFAASFLMPEEVFKAEFYKDSSILSLASKFMVSQAAAKYRRDVLKLR